MYITAHGIVGATFVVVMLVTSAYFYNHRGRWYAEGKGPQIPAVPGFGMLYRYVQLTSLVASIGAFLFNHPLLLEAHDNPALIYTGLGAAAAGLVLFVWAKVELGREYSPCFDSFVPGRLVSTGPYALVRHPIYSANLLLLAGLALATGSLWVVANLLIVGFYYVTSARREEAALATSLTGYREYMSRTGRFLPSLPAASRPAGPAASA